MRKSLILYSCACTRLKKEDYSLVHAAENTLTMTVLLSPLWVAPSSPSCKIRGAQKTRLHMIVDLGQTWSSFPSQVTCTPRLGSRGSADGVSILFPRNRSAPPDSSKKSVCPTRPLNAYYDSAGTPAACLMLPEQRILRAPTQTAHGGHSAGFFRCRYEKITVSLWASPCTKSRAPGIFSSLSTPRSNSRARKLMSRPREPTVPPGCGYLLEERELKIRDAPSALGRCHPATIARRSRCRPLTRLADGADVPWRK